MALTYSLPYKTFMKNVLSRKLVFVKNVFALQILIIGAKQNLCIVGKIFESAEENFLIYI